MRQRFASRVSIVIVLRPRCLHSSSQREEQELALTWTCLEVLEVVVGLLRQSVTRFTKTEVYSGFRERLETVV